MGVPFPPLVLLLRGGGGGCLFVCLFTSSCRRAAFPTLGVALVMEPHHLREGEATVGAASLHHQEAADQTDREAADG